MEQKNILLGSFIGLVLILGFLISIKVYSEPKEQVVPEKGFYGYDGRLYNQQGDLVAIHEPIFNRIRPVTLTDKLFYGELK